MQILLWLVIAALNFWQEVIRIKDGAVNLRIEKDGSYSLNHGSATVLEK